MILNHVKAISLGAQVQTVRGHHPFVLDDPAMMWLVLSGSAEVLGSVTENGFPVGARRAVCRAAVGDAIFAMTDNLPDPCERLIVLAIEDLSLLGIPTARMEEICSAVGVDVCVAVEGWVRKLSAFLAEGTTPASAERISDAGELTLEGDQAVRGARDTVAWVRLDEGKVCLMGLQEFDVGPGPARFPLGGEIWLRACEPSRLRIVNTEDLGGHDEILSAIRFLHTIFLKRLRLRNTAEQQNELARLEEREAIQRRYASSALDTMAAVLNPRPVIQQRETPVLSAMALVGEALGIEIKPPPKSADRDRFDDPVAAIARASRVRHRKVLLRGAWWKTDCGPLLAYRADGRCPVAVLRGRGGGYDIIDPQTRERIRVNDRTAGVLAPEAVTIYRRLPDSLREPLQLVRFLLRGKSTDLLFLLAMATLATLIGMLTPLATALVMDTAIPGADKRLLVELGLALLAAAFGAAVFQVAQGFVSIRMATSSAALAQPAVWDRLLSLRVSFFNRFTRGDLLDRVTAVSQVSKELNGVTIQSILAALMSLLNLGLLAYFSMRLATIAVGLAIAVAAVTIVGGYFINRHVRLLMDLRGTFFGLVVQMVNSVSKIRVAGAQRRAFTKWVNGYTEQLKVLLRAQAVEDYVIVFNQAVPAISTVLLFWIAVELLLGPGPGDGAAPMSIGIFLAFYTAMGLFLSGATSLSITLVATMETLTQGKRIQPILQAEQEVDESKVDPGRLVGGLSTSHVDFRYSEGGRRILDDLTLYADPGEFIALVGPSGSGKSTIFKLLLGFETPQSGTVMYDGQDLRSLDTTAVRRQLGVVLQSGQITAGSILDNIGAGAQITLDDAWEAAADSGLADDIQAMPMGFHTIVSEGGTNFSGGQRQRLMIARALVRKPRILLMDEATSAVDNKTQAIITESLERRKVTRILIAHRFSTIRHANRIYVLDRGRVVEEGRFDQLAEGNALFASMMARQMA